jgi:hypothetical protein
VSAEPFTCSDCIRNPANLHPDDFLPALTAAVLAHRSGAFTYLEINSLATDRMARPPQAAIRIDHFDIKFSGMDTDVTRSVNRAVHAMMDYDPDLSAGRSDDEHGIRADHSKLRNSLRRVQLVNSWKNRINPFG